MSSPIRNNEPQTPDNSLRKRSYPSRAGLHIAGEFTATEESPSSATISESTSGLFGVTDTPRSAFRSSITVPLNLGSPGRKVAIRSDPALVSCFDPTERVLYDLWVAK